MLDRNSRVKFTSHEAEGFDIIESQTRFDASTRSLTVFYEGTRVITSTERCVFEISNFKNPVNKKVKNGFSITTLDS